MRRFPLPIWIILSGTLLFGLSYFMTWPFLAIVLKRDFAMNPTEIGAVLSLAAFVGAGASLISGNLSDRFGRKAIILIANTVLALAFVMMATADTAFWIITGAVLVISMRHIADPPRRALITDLISDKDTRDLAFHLNYFMVNVGATTGPFIALFFGISARQSTFWVSAVVIGAYTLALLAALWRIPNRHVGGEQTHWREVARVLAADRVFRWMMIGSILVAYTYAQQDSSVVQYLSNSLDYEQAAFFFSFVVAGNSATVVLAQFPLLAVMKHWSYDARIRFGVTGFMAGFIVYALIPVDWLPGWVIGTVLLSVGEAVLFPTLNLKTDQIAPAHLKGTYFGASNLYALGYGLGPLFGGMMIGAGTGPLLWVVAAAICVLSILAHGRSAVMQKRRDLLGVEPT
ncbi:MDR family MFS transporter [Reinekea blandensis]|uniref:Permease n=1 Tax=Reinekea blandensis MED297 TaxID=314283 RepID=A4BDF3_9GAMM|nr:MFS transporter [Reinekea blandensis]EAR09897.1 permease [Reinekea sp. MED297] [Reinekea blandensis MED297]